MARTWLSPICWATSAVMTTCLPSTVMSNSSAWLISGSASGGNSTSITGPMMPTMRPSFEVVSVMVISVLGLRLLRCVRLWLGSTGAPAPRVGQQRGDVDVDAFDAGRPQGLGTADDLHDLGRDRVLTGAVHLARQLDVQFFGVVGRRLHRALAAGVLGGRAFEHGAEQAGFDVARQECGRAPPQAEGSNSVERPRARRAPDPCAATVAGSTRAAGNDAPPLAGCPSRRTRCRSARPDRPRR